MTKDNLKYYNEFEEFCESNNILYVENGFLEGNQWKHKGIIAPYHRLYIVLEGEGVVTIGEKVHHLTGGNAYIIPAYTDFNSDSPVYFKKLFVHFMTRGPIMETIFSGYDDILSTKISIPVYEQCYEWIESGDLSGYYQVKNLYNNLIYGFIERFLQTHPINSITPMNQEMKKIYQIIDHYLSAKLRVGTIAEEMHMTRSTLSRYYKNQTGETLKSYIQRRVMVKAQLLLLTKDWTIQAIANEVGFDDNLYFSRVFRKETGYSPSKYRQMNMD